MRPAPQSFSSSLWLFLLLLLGTLPACEQSDALFSKNTTVPVYKLKPAVKPKPPPKEPKPDPVFVCKKFLQDHPQVITVAYPERSTVALEIESNRIIDETSLVKWLSGFLSQIFYERQCPWDKVTFITRLSETEYYEGLSRRDDYDLYKKGRISQAEWTRRFEIKKLATVASIKNNLKRAREAADHGKALGYVDELIKRDPYDIGALIIKGNILLDQGAAAEALAVYESVLKMAPQNVLARFNQAYAQARMGRFSEAIAGYQSLIKALKMDPGLSDQIRPEAVWLYLADVYLKNNQAGEAAQALENAEPKTDTPFKLLKANLLRAQKRPQEARAILEELVEAGKGGKRALFNLVLVNLDLKDLKASRAAFAKLKAGAPKLADELAFLPPFKEGP